MRKLYFLLLLVSVCLVMACRQVLPKDRMVDLLTDMYLYDEEFAKGMQGADSVSFYRSIFIKHGCREEEYKKAVACYAKKPKVMREIYEAVKARLEGYRAEFEQALRLEDYLRDLKGALYDTLFYMTFDDDSTAHRRVYLPKLCIQPACADTTLVPIPEQPGQSAQPKQFEQLDTVHLKKFDKPDKLEKFRHPVHPGRPVRSVKPVEHLQPLS